MDKNTSFPVDFSDSFFDDFDNADIDAVDDSDFSVKQPSGGIDILKQSLQAANITADDSLGFGETFGDYCFDDNGSSANLTLDLDSTDNNNQQHQQDPFDTSQFLNLGNETKPSSTFQSSSVGSRSFSSNNTGGNLLTNNLAANNNVRTDSASSHHAASRIQMEDGDDSFHKNFNNQKEIAGSSSNRNVSSLYGNSSNNIVQVRQQPIQIPVSYASNNQTRQHIIPKQNVKITNDPNNPSRPIYQVSNQSVGNKSIVVVQGGEQKVVNLQTLNIVSSSATNSNQSAHSGGQQQNNFTVVLPNNATSGGMQQSKAVWTINNNQKSSASQNTLDGNAGTAKSQLTAKYQGNYPAPSSNHHSPRVVATATSKQQLTSQVKAQYYITNLPAHLPTSNTNTRTSSNPVALRPIKNLQATKPRSSGFVGMRIASVNIPISASSSSTTNQTSVVNGTVASTKVGLGVDKQRQVISVHSKPSATDKVVKYVFDRPRTPDKPRQVSKPQLQKLLSQQPAAKPSPKPSEASHFDPTKTIRKVWNGSQYTTVATTNMTQILDKQRSGSRSSHLTFRVDPGLSLSQIDEVQRNIRERSNNHKSFNPQQKQLQSAFWAHIHSMEVTVQEYYIRNPQLFTQKVHHHFVKTKKPFFVVVKSPSSSLLLTSSAAAAANFTSNKIDKSNNHPTISLTGSNNRTKSPIPKPRINDHSVKTAVKRAINSSSIPCIKQEYEDPPIVPLKRPSMIQEQLEAHQKMVLQPDTVTPFKNIRDCVRRLLPYHVYNVPEVKKEDFEESEIIFQKIADRSYTTMHKMFAKYHQLFLKDTVREVSSPDAVMLDRIFLQDEKQKFMLEKKQIHDDPLQLTKYLRMDNERERMLADDLKDEARRKTEAQKSSEVVVAAHNQQQQPQQHHHGSSTESEALALQQAVNSIL